MWGRKRWDRGFYIRGRPDAAKSTRRFVCHFVRERGAGMSRTAVTRGREVYFGSGPELKGRDVLVVDAVLESGV